MANTPRSRLKTRKSFVEKLSGVKSLDKAIEVQTEYAKSAYETFVAESQKIAGLYTDLAKQTFKPLEGMVAKFTPAAAPDRIATVSRIKKPGRDGRAFFLWVRSVKDYRATRSLRQRRSDRVEGRDHLACGIQQKKFCDPLAQYDSTGEVGSGGLLVLTWMV